MSRPDLALEQKVLRAFKSLPEAPQKLLLAVSGGLDSMVMAEILWRWRRGLKLGLAVAHIHHGPADSAGQARFRNRALSFTRAWAEERGLEFFTNPVPPPRALQSEQEWRDWRERHLREWKLEFDAVAIAHHQDDLLETRVIRLIRGSGAQGLRSMSAFAGGRWRPLLGVTRSEILNYGTARKLVWLEDPSNGKTKALRNWLRREWLPSLESKRPGALNALARSLENLAPELSEFDLAPFVGLRRAALAGCPVSERRELLARYLKALGVRGYALTHVNEILKRLDVKAAHSEFEMLGLIFKISPDVLWASRV